MLFYLVGSRDGGDLFLHRYTKASAAGGATDNVVAGGALEAQRCAAMGAFAEDVRSSVAHAQIETAEGAKKLAEETAYCLIFLLPFVDVAGH